MYSKYYSYYPCSDVRDVPHHSEEVIRFTSESELYSFLKKLPKGSRFVCFVPLFGGDQLASVTGDVYEDGKVIIW